MRFAVVTYHLPHPDGTATGRHVFAVWDAMRTLGHDVEAWCWGDAPRGLEAPEWVTVQPFLDPGGWRRKPATVWRPRWGLAATGWRAPAGAVAWAEEPESYAAIAGATQRGVTVYHSELLDAVALRRSRPAVVQAMRAERRAVRRADVAITFSPRVARAVGVHDRCPVTLPIPPDPLPLVAEPIALLLANWSWQPNQVALARLLAAWPRVRARLPAARLLIAGRGPVPAGSTGDGVEVVGEVARAADVMRRAAVLAFPCPPTSGPKMKVLDALAHGLPVVTTPAGVEGLQGVEAAVEVAGAAGFATALTDVLADSDRRARMAEASRRAVVEHHSPALAARCRLAVISDRSSLRGRSAE